MFVAMIYTRASKKKKEAEEWLNKILDEIFDPENPDSMDLYQGDIEEVKND